MARRRSSREAVIARRTADIDALRRAIVLLNEHSSLHREHELAARVLTKEVNARLKSLRRLMEAKRDTLD